MGAGHGAATLPTKAKILKTQEENPAPFEGETSILSTSKDGSIKRRKSAAVVSAGISSGQAGKLSDWYLS